MLGQAACIQAVKGVELYCYTSMSGHILMYHCRVQRMRYKQLLVECWVVIASFASCLSVATGIPDLAVLTVTEVSVNVECCPSRNCLFSYVQLYKYREKSPVEI